MIWLYVVLLVVIAAAFVGMLWLRREGERAWRAHRIRVLTAPIRAEFLRFQLDLVDNVTPALQEMGRKLEKVRASLERAYGPRIRKAMRESLAHVADYQKGDE